jgi:CcmD family protein
MYVMIRRRFALLLALALAAGVPSLAAQEGATPPAAQVAQSESAPAASAAEPAATSGAETHGGVPRLAQPTAPRTLRAYWHVFIAFAITWLLLFGYALSLGRRLGKMEERMAAQPRG